MSASAHHRSSPDEPRDDGSSSAGWELEHERRVVRGGGLRSTDRRGDFEPEAHTTRLVDSAPTRVGPRPATQVEPLPELTATGAALTVGLIVSFAGVLDRLLSPGLGVIFGFVFVLASVYAAIRMCWRDSWAALALPPLVFVVAAGISAQFSSTAEGGWVSRISTEIATAVLDHPFYLLAGTALAAACLAYRARVE